LISNRTEEVIETLTIVASVFVALTFLVGIYDVNFERMPEPKVVGLPGVVDPDDHHGRRNDALLLAQRMYRPTIPGRLWR